MTQTPLILFPGVGADARLFSSQRNAFPELVVPPWITPLPYEPLADYAARFAKVIDPGCPCFLGGVSFGGVVALEVSTHLAARECYLLGSIRDTREIPRRLKLFRPMPNLIMIPKWMAPLVLGLGERWMRPLARGVFRQFHETDARFLRWAAWAILNWKPSPGVANLKIAQIHGDRDRVFPLSHREADLVIPGAGHLVSITHAKEVNQFIRQRMTASLEQPPQEG